MNAQILLPAVLGGVLIGLAAALFYALNGRIAGVSGIFGDLFLERSPRQWQWRGAFVGGIVLGYLIVRLLHPEHAGIRPQVGWIGAAVAGLLVGYGTRMGCGCTSGHGICGTARLSPRSIAATLVFILAGMATTALIRHSGWLP
ncbi:MAG: YeeE/YedE family protein [Rhodanobacteraceae bacterium]|jgi:uncharacterized membrane protein YedE/YeeE|nr:YeeE/YedE family protein [Rhodanobacteraceae bacterium]